MKKLTIIPILFCLFISYSTLAQFLTWQWSLTEGDELNEYITAIATDDDGNFYVTGSFQGTFDFFGTVLSSVGNNDVFIAGFNDEGSLLWVKQGGGGNEDIGNDIVVSGEYIYVTGGYREQAVFEDNTLISAGARDMFLLKYDFDGDLIWAKSGGGVSDDVGNSIAADESGNIYMTGDINFMANFGDYTVPFFGFTDLFIAKYNSDGDCLWAKSAGGTLYDYGGCIETSGDHVFIAGAFNTTAQFDTASITSVDFVDIYVAHYTSDGSLVEVHSAGGTSNENVNCMVVDSEMNLYIGGWYLSDITIGNTNLLSDGGSDIFITKFEPGVGFTWAESYGGPGDDEAHAISNGWIAEGKRKSADSFILAGTFRNEATFSGYQLTSDGFDDGFILQHENDGPINWIQKIGGGGTLRIHDCLVYNGNCYFVGDFVEEMIIGNKTYNAAGGYDLFIANLGHGIGIDEQAVNGNTNLILYPNPVGQKLYVNYELRSVSDVFIKVLDPNGKLIKELHVNNLSTGNQTQIIEIKDLTKGVYFITVTTGQQTETRKILRL